MILWPNHILPGSRDNLWYWACSLQPWCLLYRPKSHSRFQWWKRLTCETMCGVLSKNNMSSNPWFIGLVQSFYFVSVASHLKPFIKFLFVSFTSQGSFVSFIAINVTTNNHVVIALTVERSGINQRGFVCTSLHRAFPCLLLNAGLLYCILLSSCEIKNKLWSSKKLWRMSGLLPSQFN